MANSSKTILCYGDSNTWGFVAGSIDWQTFYMERYPRDIRWTGLLQQQLGDDYYIIEEGLNGRTTNVDHPELPNRNGKPHLPHCLYSHAPLDLVLLMLGTNDLNTYYNRSAADVASGLDELVTIIQETQYGPDMQSPPNILLVNPPTIANESYQGVNGDYLFAGAIEKSKQLASHIEKLAKEKGCYYFDSAPYVQFSSVDGIHLDEQAHAHFAEMIAHEIKQGDVFNR